MGGVMDEPTVTFRVLIVDDEPDVCELMRLSLERAGGLEICGKATTAADALDMARATDPDVVVLDYDLGTVMTGLDVAMQMRDVVPAAHIVMFSAFLGEGDSFDGVDAVYAKDKAGELATALRQMLGLTRVNAGPVMPCSNPACRTKIPLSQIDIRDEFRTVTCEACGVTRSWSISA